MGVWIEIADLINLKNINVSLPLWECGLKFLYAYAISNGESVTPLVGVWIEINRTYVVFRHYDVTPLVGVWIEISSSPVMNPW